MDINKLLEKYNMSPHEENGKYCECHYKYNGTDRAPSGSTVFYTGPDESTMFHRIDCDEYWCYNAGSNLDVWIINESGELTISSFGIEGDAKPLIYFPKGVIFASKHRPDETEGTFFTCITVPRFDYKGFELIQREEIIRLCPKAERYFDIL